jgi:hypothetical protein
VNLPLVRLAVTEQQQQQQKQKQKQQQYAAAAAVCIPLARVFGALALALPALFPTLHSQLACACS